MHVAVQGCDVATVKASNLQHTKVMFQGGIFAALMPPFTSLRHKPTDTQTSALNLHM